jgi:hypothetical protein
MMESTMALMSSAELAARLREEDLLVCDCRFAVTPRRPARAI